MTDLDSLTGSSEEGSQELEPDSASRSGAPKPGPEAEDRLQDNPDESTQAGRAMLLSKFAEAMRREPSPGALREQAVAPTPMLTRGTAKGAMRVVENAEEVLLGSMYEEEKRQPLKVLQSSLAKSRPPYSAAKDVETRDSSDNTSAGAKPSGEVYAPGMTIGALAEKIRINSCSSPLHG